MIRLRLQTTPPKAGQGFIFMKPKSILITGASGFIGSALMAHIQNKKIPCRLSGIGRRVLKQIRAFDLCDQKALKKFLLNQKPQYIFHLAGGRKTDDQKTFESNFTTTKILFQAICEIPGYRPRVLIPGTAAEYGPVSKTSLKVDETTFPRPASWYGFVKYMQTSYGLMHAKRGMDIVVARMFNILGAGVPSTLVIGRFAQELAAIERGEQKPIIQTQRLNTKRDFLDIGDVCEALLGIMSHGKSGELYNICSGRLYEIGELLKQMIRLSTVKGIVVKEDKDLSSESFDISGSNKKLKRAMTWSPHVSMKDSLKSTLDFYRNPFHAHQVS